MKRFEASQVERMIAEAKEEAFYGGTICALAVIAAHDEETLYREIVNTVDQAALIKFARKESNEEWSGLIKYGFIKPRRRQRH